MEATLLWSRETASHHALCQGSLKDGHLTSCLRRVHDRRLEQQKLRCFVVQKADHGLSFLHTTQPIAQKRPPADPFRIVREAVEMTSGLP